MDFQTPPPVCNYMADLLVEPCHHAVGSILEPTPGQGNLVKALRCRHPHADIIAPTDFFDLLPGILTGKIEYPRFDYIAANPPFSPMIHGWKFLQHFIKMSDRIVCLLPWFVMLNSNRRFNQIMGFGLESITYLPRETFPNSRIQCCILNMNKTYKGATTFKSFNSDFQKIK